MWLTGDDGAERLRAKLHADLQDLAALKAAILDAAPTVVDDGDAAAGDGAAANGERAGTAG
jgi:hypothetical protein